MFKGFLISLIGIIDLGLISLGIEIFIFKSKREHSRLIFSALFVICIGISFDIILTLLSKPFNAFFFPVSLIFMYFILGYKLIFKFINFYDKLTKNSSLEKELVAYIQNTHEQVSEYLEGKDDVAIGRIKTGMTGGDYYAYKEYSSDCDLFIIGDIQAKGLTGAFFETMSRSYMDVFAQRKLKPDDFLFNINHFIITRDTDKGRMTMFICKRDKKNNEITVAGAGHVTQYLFNLRMNKFIPLKATGKMIGQSADSQFSKRSYKYEKGDILLLFTDGLHKPVNSKSEKFGQKELLSIVKKTASREPIKIIEMILKNFGDFGVSRNINDDVTILVIKL